MPTNFMPSPAPIFESPGPFQKLNATILPSCANAGNAASRTNSINPVEGTIAPDCMS